MDWNVEQCRPAKSGRARAVPLNRLYSKGFRGRRWPRLARV